MRILFLIFAIFIATLDCSTTINPKIIGPVLIEAATSLDIFNAGKISMYGLIKLGVTDNDFIYLQGTGINYPQNNLSSYLGINQAGQLITVAAPEIQISDLVAASEPAQFISLGIFDKNYFGFTSDSSDVVLNGLTQNANVYISADSNIFLSSSNISLPGTDQYYNLGINSAGQVISMNGSLPPLDGIFNNLTGARSLEYAVTLGCPASNYFYFQTGEGNFIVNALADLLVSAPNGNANLSGDQVTIEGNNVFCGSSLNTNIVMNDSLSSTMALKATELLFNSNKVQFGNDSLWPSDCSVSNYLMIDCNGYLTIYCSSKKYKTDLQYLNDLPENYFDFIDLMQACQFRYKNQKNPEKNAMKNLSVGYIAEDFDAQEELKRFVIYNQDGAPMSIDYNSVLVAMIYVLQKKLKDLTQKLITIDQQDQEINLLRDRVNMLELKFRSLEKNK